MDLTEILKETYQHWRTQFGQRGALREISGDFSARLDSLHTSIDAKLPNGSQIAFSGDYFGRRPVSFEDWLPETLLFESANGLTELTIDKKSIILNKCTARSLDMKHCRSIYAIYNSDGALEHVSVCPSSQFVTYYDVSEGVARRTGVMCGHVNTRSPNEIVARLKEREVEAPETFNVSDLAAGLAIHIKGRKCRLPRVPEKMDEAYINSIFRIKA